MPPAAIEIITARHRAAIDSYRHDPDLPTMASSSISSVRSSGGAPSVARRLSLATVNAEVTQDRLRALTARIVDGEWTEPEESGF
ncbi:MAG: hypothetical protein Q8O67_21785 [Deltaproteobacteria bacterium]|nr:hypothetical protein [Deltaproteobacteria bacterium]